MADARDGVLSVSARLAAAPVYSYAADKTVPPFDDTHGLIIYDGVCVLCSHSMRAIAARDRVGLFQYASAQSRLGQALFRHYGLNPVTFETVLLISRGHAFGKLDMVFEIVRALGGALQLFAICRLLPRGLQDKIYDLVATHRYRLFGRSLTCLVPDASWRARVMDHPAE